MIRIIAVLLCLGAMQASTPTRACDDEAAERAARALERIAHDIHNQQ